MMTRSGCFTASVPEANGLSEVTATVRWSRHGKTPASAGTAAPPPLPAWTILCAGAKARWVGEVKATDQNEAIVKAAAQFKLPSSKLIDGRAAFCRKG